MLVTTYADTQCERTYVSPTVQWIKVMILIRSPTKKEKEKKIRSSSHQQRNRMVRMTRQPSVD